MPTAPWDNPDVDDFESRQAELEGAGDWADSEAEWHQSPFVDDSWADDHVGSATSARRSSTGLHPPELIAPIARQKRFRIFEQLDGKSFVRTEMGWFHDGVLVTLYPLIGRLDRQLETRLRHEDRTEMDPRELVRRAWIAQALQHPDRVGGLATRTLKTLVDPPDPTRGGDVVRSGWRAEAHAAAAMLCSALRQQRDSARALDETELFADDEYPPLMTSRAAAMCDVGHWEEGRQLAIRSRDISDSPEVIQLLERIDRHFNAVGSPVASGDSITSSPGARS